jgi:hypothetical protein
MKKPNARNTPIHPVSETPKKPKPNLREILCMKILPTLNTPKCLLQSIQNSWTGETPLPSKVSFKKLLNYLPSPTLFHNFPKNPT